MVCYGVKFNKVKLSLYFLFVWLIIFSSAIIVVFWEKKYTFFSILNVTDSLKISWTFKLNILAISILCHNQNLLCILIKSIFSEEWENISDILLNAISLWTLYFTKPNPSSQKKERKKTEGFLFLFVNYINGYYKKKKKYCSHRVFMAYLGLCGNN